MPELEVKDKVKDNEEKVKDSNTKKKGLSLTDIVLLLEQGYSPSSIAKKFQCSKANISYFIRKAKQNGLIQETMRSTGIVGFSVDKKAVKDGHGGVVGTPISNNKIEIHHIDFRFKIIKDNERFVLKDTNTLNNGTEYHYQTLSNGIRLEKFNNGSLLVKGIKVEAESYDNAIAKATSYAIDIKNYLEKRFKIRLTKNPDITKLPDIVPKLHSFIKEEVKELAKEHKVKAEDGFVIDESEGEGQGHAEYRLSLLKDKAKRTSAVRKAEILANMPDLLDMILEQQFIFSMNLKQHLDVLQKIRNAIEKLNETIGGLKR